MAGIRRTRVKRVWLWRRRRNPLRRRSDVVEAWIVLVTCLVALLGGLLVGEAAGSATERGLLARRAAAHTVTAVLVENADGTSKVTTAGTDELVRAKVRWTAPDGSTRAGQTRVEPGSVAGTSVTVWIDRGGNLVRTPPTAVEARLQGTLTGVLVAIGTGALVVGCGWLARLRLDRRRLRDWEAEWARVAPSGGLT